MPRIFTIFNHGTDFHRDKLPQEVVTQLHNALDGPEAMLIKTGDGPADWSLEYPDPTHLICEGPGSPEVQTELSSSGKIHAHPGKHNPIFNTPKGTSPQNLGLTPKGNKQYIIAGNKGYTDFQKDFSGDTASRSRITGRVLGRGWDDNIYKALFLITHLQGIGKKPDIINIVGWSRGAVTCLKMANKIYEIYGRTIWLNIFAIDPVIGGLTWTKEDMITIPPNVLNYIAILALDDDRANFQPTDRTLLRIQVPVDKGAIMDPTGRVSNPVPNVQFIPLPGNHSDMVNAGKTNEAEASGMLCLHLAWKFLSNHGSVFSDTSKTQKWNMDTSIIRHMYSLLGTNMETISTKASSGLITAVGGRRMKRDVHENRNQYVRGSEFFINEHHRMCCVTPTIQLQQPANPSFQHTLLKSSTKYVKNLPFSDLYQMGINYNH